MAKLSYLERLKEETLRPVRGAMELMMGEIRESMNIPDAPWKILNVPYDQLTEEQMIQLFDIYHTPGESDPCPMCSWTTRMELMKARKDKDEGV